MHARANQISCSLEWIGAGDDRGDGVRGSMLARTQRQPENVLLNNFFRQVGTSLADSELNSMLLRAGGRRDDSEPGHGLVLRPHHKLLLRPQHPPSAGSPVPVIYINKLNWSFSVN